MSGDLKAKLAQLKELHELGLLTETAYQQQQAALLSAAMGTTPLPAGPSPLSGATRVESSSPAPTPANPLSGATTVDASAGLPSRLGNYRVLGLIGAGGMGTVVRARHDNAGWAQRQGGDVAIKLIHPHIAADPSFQERFFDEAELGKRIQHPGLATVYDVVSEGAWLGTILEYIEGQELSAWVRPGGIPVAEVVALLTPLAEALDHLHGQGIVHRDLKPANVKVRPDGRPVLLDLGIAKDLTGASGGQTKTMTTMGTSAWMAPEQADAKSVTAAADIYAFGLITYALLSGRMPWGEGESELRVLTNKMMGKLAPLSSVAPAVSAAVMGALAVDPAARPDSCGALVASLDGRRLAAAAAKAKGEAAAEAKAQEQAARDSAAQVKREAAARAKEQQEAALHQARIEWEAAAQVKREVAAREAAAAAAAAKAKGEAAARAKAQAQREAGPHPHTHGFDGPVVETLAVERTRQVVESPGFLGIGRKVRDEMYTVQETRTVMRRQECAAERFVVDGESIVLVPVPAGTYTVGSPTGEGEDDERPRHDVRLTRSYGVGVHPVTQGLYEAVMGTNPSRCSGKSDSARRPVEKVSWFEAATFCNQLSARCGLAPAYRIQGEDVRCNFGAPGFRLPTEHEWEVAARAGTDFKYAGSDDLGSVGWVRDNSGLETHPVGQKAANGWGLHDMSGNVWEWCWDWKDSSAYQSGTMADPVGPQSGARRVLRGGGWLIDASFARVAYRDGSGPSNRNFSLGFRLTRTRP